MHPRRQSAWFEFVSDEAGPSLCYDADRPLQLMRTAGSLQNRHPVLTCFLGRGRKDRALRCLFPDNPLHRTTGFQLRVDHRTLYSQRPVLFADGDPRQSWQPCGVSSPPRVEQISIGWAPNPDPQVYNVLLARALLPFSHVLCLFAEDLGGVEQAANLLDGWARVGRGATQPSMRPRLIVAVEADEGHDPDKFPFFQRPDAPELYSSVRLFYVSQQNSLSDEARYRPLKEEIFKALDWAARDRQETGTFFSAAHLPGLLEQAVRHTARSPQEPFNLIDASRPLSDPIGWTTHLSHFLHQGTGIPSKTQDAIIASSLLVDAFPPDTHAFHPRDLYRQRYWQQCLDALQHIVGFTAAVHRSQSIESRLVDAYACMLARQVPPWDSHLCYLQELQPLFQQLFSNRTCLSCLLYSPQHSLDCGHAICDSCVERCGSPRPRAESVYVVDRCPLCQRACTACVTLLPRTAAVRALAVDGGGVRGVVSLQILMELQDLLGPICLLQELFDVAFGTSAGGLIVLDIFARRKPIAQCLDAFQRLLFDFFNSQPQPRRLLAWPRRIIRSAMGRGLYDSEKAESLLQQHYSSNQRLFGPGGLSGTKIAVTTTTAEDTVILTNYKSSLARPRNAGYRDLSVCSPEDEPFIWQCARATSAVPMLFGPFALSTLGDCWDGGLENNNPAGLCRQELQYMWPWRPPLGILLNIGAGERAEEACRSRTGPHPPRSLARRHFLWPVLRSFMKTMDGKISWLRLWHHTACSEREPLSRLDIQLSGPEPRLDAAHCMSDLIQQAALQGVGDHGRRCLLRLLAQSLFFELVAAPERDINSWSYRCRGVIRCRVPGDALISALQHVDTSQKEFVFGNRPLRINASEDAVCHKCGRYCVPVQFSVDRLDDVIVLSVRLEDGARYPVGGFPNPMRWFMDRQGVSPMFGFSGPWLASRDDCVACEKRLISRRNLRVRQLQARRVVRIARANSYSAQRASIVN
ncbi:hypothetical protein EYZ11_003790 [Aspergillus tanneri]|uniref:PNPLA domain-containing protein n=1 Tax=Aspergillus tanneri TaxID=1220188 RepID=A0A4S3JMF0_9EURO|nr:uncharacterized protein ATNIH1004_001684 [Aspergillus tanneri]KAA8652779.1 hypothetical protein ATNIH1004_001684 [Aspergillus tanneri]THC96732.1 hypothetical protein EYZ11_003790 [Aspergillus tanneri]